MSTYSHGYSKRKQIRPEYISWYSMLRRCNNPKDKEYHNYGGRGISVCERWSKFENFIADMGDKPSPHHSLDRYPDKNGNYEPSNCRWATMLEQGLNRRTNRNVTYMGKTQTVSQWSQELGINDTTIYQRIRYGWTMEEALSTPVKTSK